MSTIVDKYFPEITPHQRSQFEALQELYSLWNSRINVISRKDIDALYLKHVLHSLSIARVLTPAPGARILDIGCGGGFPSVPLAILFPQAGFTAADSVGKKITVVQEVCKALSLSNVSAVNCRAESLDGSFDYAISRAVAPMSRLIEWCWDKISPSGCGNLPGGLLALKGGDLEAELAATGKPCVLHSVSEWFDEEFFETKKIVFIEKR